MPIDSQSNIGGDIEMLYRECFDVLIQYTTGRAGNQGLLTEIEVKPIERAYQIMKYHDPDLLRVALIGDFKTGKSTLLNALAGKVIAAVDLFEMTSWVARYWPSESSFCLVTIRDSSTNDLSPSEFLQRCESRSWTKEELGQITRVDVGVSESDLPCAMIDCPGLGSTTQENEKRLIEALEEADALFFTLDVEAVGSIRSSSLLDRLRREGTPIWVILTKCDLLAGPNELEEIRTWVSREFRIHPSNVLASAAVLAIRDMSLGRTRSIESGIGQLRERLLNDLSCRRSALRLEAEDSHRRLLMELVESLLERVDLKLRRILKSSADFAVIIQTIKEAVQAQIEVALINGAQQAIIGESRPALQKDLENVLRKGGALSAETITQVFRTHLGDDYLDTAWQQLSGIVSSRVVEFWKHELDGFGNEIEAVFSALEFQGRDLAINLSEKLSLQAEGIAMKTFNSGVQASVGIAGVATAWAAWLGPAAAQIGLGSALTGVGIPIALMGTGVSLAMYHWKKKTEQERIASKAVVLLDLWSEQFVEGVVKEQFLPIVRQMNEQIATDVVHDFTEKLSQNVPLGDINKQLEVIGKLKAAIAVA